MYQTPLLSVLAQYRTLFPRYLGRGWWRINAARLWGGKANWGPDRTKQKKCLLGPRFTGRVGSSCSLPTETAIYASIQCSRSLTVIHSLRLQYNKISRYLSDTKPQLDSSSQGHLQWDQLLKAKEKSKWSFMAPRLHGQI